MARRSLFSYYGGKGRLAHNYPAPIYPTVIEPFAGGASYSLSHVERNVLLNDLDDVTMSIWRVMLDHPLESILAGFPETVVAGQRVSEMVDLNTVHPGIANLLRAAANIATMGATGVHDVVTDWAVPKWGNAREAIAYWHPRIQHWKAVQGDYRDLQDCEATWFIDPPYMYGQPSLRHHKDGPSPPGAHYRTCVLDNDELAEFVRSRSGQVIVCDDVVAPYLPFRVLRQTLSTGTSEGMKGSCVEGIYVQQNGVDITDSLTPDYEVLDGLGGSGPLAGEATGSVL